MRTRLQALRTKRYPCDNAGQVLAFLLQGHDAQHNSKRQLLEDVAKVPVPAAYRAAYEDWCALVAVQGWACTKARLATRLLIGLGMDTVLETHVTLHHVYGVPYIPGASLKGLAKACAENLSGEESGMLSPDQIDWLFGSLESAGNLDFQDAWWIPEGLPLCLEVDTPHHVDYYRSRGETPATDFDDPTPLHQLAVQGSFFLSIAGDALPAQLALALLTRGLQDWGIGGRVNADYGRFENPVATTSNTNRRSR